jgi:hypothetical protein
MTQLSKRSADKPLVEIRTDNLSNTNQQVVFQECLQVPVRRRDIPALPAKSGSLARAGIMSSLLSPSRHRVEGRYARSEPFFN